MSYTPLPTSAIGILVDATTATTPISVASLPLPTGASTEATLSALNAKHVTTANGIKVDGSGATQPISASSLPLPTGASTEATLLGLSTKITTTANGLKVDNSAVTQPVSVTSLPLPTGASTEATLSALNTKVTTSAIGVKVDAAVTSLGDIVDNANSSTSLLLANASFTGTWVNVLNYSQIVCIVSTDVSGTLLTEFSTDGVNVDHTHTYAVQPNVGETVQVHSHAKYYRIVYTNGITNQTTFRLQTILRPVSGQGSIIEADDTITAYDDCVLTKSILTGQSVLDGSYINAKMSPDGGLIINQDIQVIASNSSTANLAANATFTGAVASNITATAIQIFLKTDQNCTVYLDQSQDGVNWDVSDTLNYYASIGNFAPTCNAVGVFYRLRVTNNGTSATTYFRLQSIVVPMLSTLPRVLRNGDLLKTSVENVQDANGFVEYYTPHGEQISVPLYRLTGSGFTYNILDTNYWTPSIGTGGSASVTNGTLILSTGVTANNTVSIQSSNVARFVEGYPNKFRANFRLGTGTSNVTLRGGYFDVNDGAFFELAGTTLSLVTRKTGVDTKVGNGSFNGKFGSIFTLDTSSHKWEILLTKTAVYFEVDNNLIHKTDFKSTGVSWASSFDLPVRFEIFNTGGSITNNTFNILNGIILREGLQNTQPKSVYIAGANAGILLKLGAGNVQGFIIGDNSGSITIYDNTSAAGTPITALTPSASGSVDLKGIPFNIGLFAVTTGANSKVTVLYE